MQIAPKRIAEVYGEDIALVLLKCIHDIGCIEVRKKNITEEFSRH